jgi:hypothetical protein
MIALVKFIPVVFLAVLVGACDSQGQQNEFVDDAELPPSGDTTTDILGEVLTEDRDDWRTSPIYAGKIRVDPVYPNPSAGQFVTIPVSVLEFGGGQGGVVLRAEDNQGSLRLIDELLDAQQPGAYILRFSPSALGRTGLIRLFIFDRLGELISYGDLKVN